MVYDTTRNSSVWLTKEAINLSNKLMTILQIQQGSNLAKLLGVNPIFYNDEAIRVWVQRELNDGLSIDRETLKTLQKRFLDIMKSHNLVVDLDYLFFNQEGF